MRGFQAIYKMWYKWRCFPGDCAYARDIHVAEVQHDGDTPDKRTNSFQMLFSVLSIILRPAPNDAGVANNTRLC